MAIYRWAELCVSVEEQDILTPLVWQRFFALFLERWRPECGSTNLGSQGQRFFESFAQSSTLRIMKNHLSRLVTHHSNIAEELGEVSAGMAGESEGDQSVNVASNVAAADTIQNAERQSATSHSDQSEQPLSDDATSVDRDTAGDQVAGAVGTSRDGTPSGSSAATVVNSATPDNQAQVAITTSTPAAGSSLHSDSDLQEKDFHKQLSRLYSAMSLWLDEPRLHLSEPYLDVLPPQYNARYLTELFASSTQPWLQFLDDARVTVKKNCLCHAWQHLAGLSANMQRQRTCSMRRLFLEASSPDESRSLENMTGRILKRLHCPEKPCPPPPVIRPVAPFEAIRPSALLSGDLLVSDLREDLSAFTDAARSYEDRVSKHLAVDVQYLEDVQHIFFNKDTELLLEVPCEKAKDDHHECQVPALVFFQFEETKQDEAVGQRLLENCSTRDRLLREALQPVANRLCKAAVCTEATVMEMIHRYRSGESMEAAVALFYKLVHMVNDSTSSYPPARQFLTACIDTLGQEFIAIRSDEMNTLLTTMLENCHLVSVLSPLFVPLRSLQEFPALHETVVNLIQSHGPSQIFALLTKFDVQWWLSQAKPQLTDCTRLMASLGQALSSCGLDPTSEHAILVELLSSQLRDLLNYQLPELYTEVMRMVITESAKRSLSLQVWNLVFGAVGCQLATDSSLLTSSPVTFNLSSDQVIETIQWIGQVLPSLVAEEMRSDESTTLYTCWQPYISAIFTVVLFFVKACIDHKCNSLSDKNSDSIKEVVEKCFNLIVDVVSPWICCRKGSRQTYLPAWREEEMVAASDMIGVFMDSVAYIDHCFPDARGSGKDSLSLLWIYYIRTVASISDCPTMLAVFHARFITLPWEKWIPMLGVFDSMIKLADYRATDAFVFVSQLLHLLDWPAVIQFYQSGAKSVQPSWPSQLHSRILLLISMLSTNEKALREEKSAVDAMVQLAHLFAWHLLGVGYRVAVKWLEDSSNPAALLNQSSAVTAMLRLLCTAAEFVPKKGITRHPECVEKQAAYLSFVVSTLSRCSCQPQLSPDHYRPVVTDLVSTLSSAVTTDSEHNLKVLTSQLETILSLLNTCSHMHGVSQVVLETLLSSIGGHNTSKAEEVAAVLALPCIEASCRVVENIQHTVQIMETCLSVHFQHVNLVNGIPDESSAAGWCPALEAVCIPEDKEKVFLDTAVREGAVLVLYANLLQRLPLCKSLLQEISLSNSLLTWSILLKVTPENEAKVILLWSKLVELITRQVSYGTPAGSIAPLIRGLVPVIARTAKEKETDGFLGALGLGKRTTLSAEFCLFARCLAAFLACQVATPEHLRLQPYAQGHPRSSASASLTAPSGSLLSAARNLNNLEALQMNRAYGNLSQVAAEAARFVADPAHCLFDGQQLIAYLLKVLFPNQRCLDVLLLGVSTS